MSISPRCSFPWRFTPGLFAGLCLILAGGPVSLPALAQAPGDSNSDGKQAAGTSGDVNGETAVFQVTPEAKAAVEHGAKMLQAERYKDAIDAFTAAVRIHPQVAQFRHLLGVAYFKNKQLGPAWIQFRQAVLRNPADANAVRDFTHLWNVVNQQGAATLGLTPEQVEKNLGAPDGKREQENRLTWQYGFMQINFVDGRLFSTVDPRGLITETLRPVDAVRFKLDGDRWRLAYRTINRAQILTEYLRPGQSLRNWEEMFNVQRLIGLSAQHVTPAQLMDTIKQKLSEGYPDFHFQVLMNDDESAMFEWRIPAKDQRQAQHEIVRLFAGRNDIHRIAYVRHIPELSPEDRSQWVDILKAAQLVAAGSGGEGPADDAGDGLINDSGDPP